MTGHEVDVLVAGGGLGGVAAALAALRQGATVVLTEESGWLGGQLTSQAVPPDEHPWIESFGCPASYRALRDGIRRYYRTWYPIRTASREQQRLNPGAGKVGPLCHEPRVALAVIEAMLRPWESRGLLTVLREHVPVAAEVDGDLVRTVDFRHPDAADLVEVRARYVLDATETGDLLPLTGTEYVTGRESVADTGEPHAADQAEPLNMQAVSICFALSHHAGEDHTADKPDGYAHWRDVRPDYWPGPQFGWMAPHPHTLEPRRYALVPNPDDDPRLIVADQGKDPGSEELWTFRRILARHHFAGFDSDITLVNWPMIDYLGGPVFDVPDADEHLAAAREQSRSFLYWLQTEATRPDGGAGWPGLRLRPDVTGTADGMAMRPYIRESRRILGLYRIAEQDVSVEVRGEHGAMRYPDSVGIGSYRIDLHPSTGGDNYIDVPAWPFQLALRALVPRRTRNLLAAGKNLAVTHITQGCYRLHPVEWTIGEAAGTLAAYAVRSGVEPHQVAGAADLVEDLQRTLTAAGAELDWPRVSYY